MSQEPDVRLPTGSVSYLDLLAAGAYVDTKPLVNGIPQGWRVVGPDSAIPLVQRAVAERKDLAARLIAGTIGRLRLENHLGVCEVCGLPMPAHWAGECWLCTLVIDKVRRSKKVSP